MNPASPQRSHHRSGVFVNRPTIEDYSSDDKGSDGTTTPREPVFTVQLAHGSALKTIGLFASLAELYELIAAAFAGEGIEPEDSIMFCTVNTPKVDMDRLLSANVTESDVLYAHVTGHSRIIAFVKSEATLGLMLSENGAGLTFIKRVADGSTSARIGLSAGMQIEYINGKSVEGLRHFNVARILRYADQGTTMIRVVEPRSSGFSMLGPRGSRSARGATAAISEATVKGGGMTLRLKADGRAAVFQGSPTDDFLPDASFVGRVNDVFEAYLGLPDEFIFDLWGLMSDVRREEAPSNGPPPSSPHTLDSSFHLLPLDEEDFTIPPCRW